MSTIIMCSEAKFQGTITLKNQFIKSSISPKKIYQWTPHGRRRRGRPQQSWRNQVTDFVRSRNVEDRHLWRLGVDGRLLTV